MARVDKVMSDQIIIDFKQHELEIIVNSLKIRELRLRSNAQNADEPHAKSPNEVADEIKKLHDTLAGFLRASKSVDDRQQELMYRHGNLNKY